MGPSLVKSGQVRPPPTFLRLPAGRTGATESIFHAAVVETASLGQWGGRPRAGRPPSSIGANRQFRCKMKDFNGFSMEFTPVPRGSRPDQIMSSQCSDEALRPPRHEISTTRPPYGREESGEGRRRPELPLRSRGKVGGILSGPRLPNGAHTRNIGKIA